MRAISLKVQITVLVIMLIAGLVALFSWTVATNERHMILSEVIKRVVLQGRNLALSSAKPLLHEDPEFELHPLISRTMKAGEDIVSIIVVDRDMRIRGHKDVLSIDRRYIPQPGLKRVQGVAVLATGEELRENDEMLELRVPITDQDEQLGYIYLQYSKSDVHYAVAMINRRMMRIGIIALVAGALISLLLAFHIARPISVLTKGAESIARGCLDTRIDIHSVREIETLAFTFNNMARSLEESSKAMLEKERMEKELEIAHTIQATLLPSRLPHLLNFEIDAYYNPASQVGGDYFDLIPIDDRHLIFVVGDVAGKGVPGLVVMAMVRILARALAERRESPVQLLRHLNLLLRKDVKRNLFVTLFCGHLDSKEGFLNFASAAHMPLLLFHSKEKVVRLVGTKTKPLGIFPDEQFTQGLEEKRIKIRPGDLVMQFTDGLNEMRNASGEEFGLERVMHVAVDAAAGGARHLLSELKKILHDFKGEAPQSDDLTLLAISALPLGIGRATEERMESLDTVVFE